MTLWCLVFTAVLVFSVLGQDNVDKKCEKIYMTLPVPKYISPNIQQVRPPPSVKPPSKKTIKKLASKLNLIAVNNPTGQANIDGSSSYKAIVKPINFKVDDLCEEKDTSLTLSSVILDGDRYCWLLYPHVGYIVRRVDCISRLCKGVKGLNVIPVPTCFFCRPTNFRTHVAYYICCKKRGRKCTIVKKEWKWPQCCSCQKFTSTLKG